MKFLALLKKELRESLIPIILATLVFGGSTTVMIREFVNYGGVDARFSGQRDLLGEVYGLFSNYPVQQIGPLLLFTSILLGLALGALHFGLPLLSRTWAFLLHRPVKRFAVLASKLLASLLAFGVALVYHAIVRPDLRGHIGFACFLHTEHRRGVCVAVDRRGNPSNAVDCHVS